METRKTLLSLMDNLPAKSVLDTELEVEHDEGVMCEEIPQNIRHRSAKRVIEILQSTQSLLPANHTIDIADNVDPDYLEGLSENKSYLPICTKSSPSPFSKDDPDYPDYSNDGIETFAKMRLLEIEAQQDTALLDYMNLKAKELEIAWSIGRTSEEILHRELQSQNSCDFVKKMDELLDMYIRSQTLLNFTGHESYRNDSNFTPTENERLRALRFLLLFPIKRTGKGNRTRLALYLMRTLDLGNTTMQKNFLAAEYQRRLQTDKEKLEMEMWIYDLKDEDGYVKHHNGGDMYFFEPQVELLLTYMERIQNEILEESKKIITASNEKRKNQADLFPIDVKHWLVLRFWALRNWLQI